MFLLNQSLQDSSNQFQEMKVVFLEQYWCDSLLVLNPSNGLLHYNSFYRIEMKTVERTKSSSSA